MSTLDHVLAHPCPTLDETGAKEQLGAYQEALKTFVGSDNVSVLTVPAGAGSGKTRTLVATIVGLLRLGVPPDLIESISFTNASADDFQEKLISNLVELEKDGKESIKVSNLGFSTIHKHAIDLLKKLEPHVGGVAYYFEDVVYSGDVNGHDDIEQAAKEKSVRLALYSSIFYSGDNCHLIEALAPFIERDDAELRFILSNIKEGNHRRQAEDFIRHDVMSDAGLGAFTNVDDGNPDYCIAVATDSLMRLYRETDSYSVEDKRQYFGLPAYMMVDEAQDLDFIQLLYLRALALNGVSILMVGDPRQTLYEFRNSVSEWPFDREFMSALFSGTKIKPRISSSPLKTNYRSRQEIIDLAEELSERFVLESGRTASQHIQKIYDPEESVVRSHPYKTGENPHDLEKNAKAVRFIEGGKTDELDFLKPRSRKHTLNTITGPMGRLTKRMAGTSGESRAMEDVQFLKRKLTHIQIPNLCGGKNQTDIEAAIHELYDRARCNEESVAILTRNGLKPADIRFLRDVLKKKYSDIDNPSSLRIEQINSEKNAPLSSYWFYGADQEAHQEIPFSSMLIGAAINYFLSWDKNASDEVRNLGLRELNAIIPASSIQEAIAKNGRYQPETTIAIELTPYLSALVSNAPEFFPYATTQEVTQQIEPLKKLMARFVTDVLMRYSVTVWESYKGRVFTHQPCRFQSVATERNQSKGQLQLRPLSDTKRYFKLFWEALVKTRFQLSESERSLLDKCGISSEWMNPSTSLLNFPEELATWKDEIHRGKVVVNSEIASRADDFIKQREVIHEQFSKLYHHKTRTYLREIAREVGRLVRLDPTSGPEYILIAGYEHFRSARQKARLSTWSNEGRNKIAYLGLFEDMLNGMRDIDIKSKPKPKSKREGESGQAVPTITVTTIHSSKGLEWEHVLLFFPQASSRDKDSSFKSARDLLYVAITRAVRTLTVIIGSDKNYKDGPTKTSMSLAKHLASQYARKANLFDRSIEMNCLATKKDETGKPRVELQTSHSELEKAFSCRLHHHIQHNRNLSSMVPLTSPSYSFFFHTAMSSICAGLIGQRMPMPDDPIIEITRLINSVATKTNLTEEEVFQSLIKNAEAPLNDLMQSMIPMYFLSGGKQFYDVMAYYAKRFAAQLSSIIVGSDLFKNLLTAKRLPDHKIWIEKPLKDVLVLDEEENQQYFPVLGIPDIKISGPKINYVCDYKTVGTLTDAEGEQDDSALSVISEKTFIQINLYQGLINKSPGSGYKAEVIYVPDITLLDGDEVPECSPPLPRFNNNAQYKVRSNLKEAVVLWTEYFDKSRFEDTKEAIADLRIAAANNLQSLPCTLFNPTPLIGENQSVEVTAETCHQCPSKVHCQQQKDTGVLIA